MERADVRRKHLRRCRAMGPGTGRGWGRVAVRGGGGGIRDGPLGYSLLQLPEALLRDRRLLRRLRATRRSGWATAVGNPRPRQEEGKGEKNETRGRGE